MNIQSTQPMPFINDPCLFLLTRNPSTRPFLSVFILQGGSVLGVQLWLGMNHLMSTWKTLGAFPNTQKESRPQLQGLILSSGRPPPTEVTKPGLGLDWLLHSTPGSISYWPGSLIFIDVCTTCEGQSLLCILYTSLSTC